MNGYLRSQLDVRTVCNQNVTQTERGKDVYKDRKAKSDIRKGKQLKQTPHTTFPRSAHLEHSYHTFACYHYPRDLAVQKYVWSTGCAGLHSELCAEEQSVIMAKRGRII